jgi:hypothetical protein
MVILQIAAVITNNIEFGVFFLIKISFFKKIIIFILTYKNIKKVT